MNKKNKFFAKRDKIIFVFIVFVFVFLSFFLINSDSMIVDSAQNLEIQDYPTVLEQQGPKDIKTDLGIYIKYLANFALIIGGVFVFGILIYGAWLYLTAAENLGKTVLAKKRIFLGFLGIIILLAAFFILNIINPELPIFYSGEVKSIDIGIILFKDDKCAASSENQLRITQTEKDLNSAFNLINGFEYQSIYFFQDKNESIIKLYELTDFTGGVSIFEDQSKNECRTVSRTRVGSVEIKYLNPGIYLIDNNTGEKIYLNKSYDNLENLGWKKEKIDRIEIRGREKAAILFSSINSFGKNSSNECAIYWNNNQDIFETDLNVSVAGDNVFGAQPFGQNKARSIVVLQKNIGTNCKISICDHSDCCVNNDPDCNKITDPNYHLYSFVYNNINTPEEETDLTNLKLPSTSYNFEEKIKSLYIYGDCSVLLIENTDLTGKCQFFSESQNNLTGQLINKCEIMDIFLNWFGDYYKPCAKALIVIPGKPI